MTLLRKWLLKWLRHKLELNQAERLMIKVGFARFYFARKMESSWMTCFVEGRNGLRTIIINQK
jgi:hypothetical protein